MSNPRDTSEYSSSLAPATRSEAEQRERTPDDRLPPGGGDREEASPEPIGMSGLDRAQETTGATGSEQTSYGDTGSAPDVEAGRRDRAVKDRPAD